MLRLPQPNENHFLDFSDRTLFFFGMERNKEGVDRTTHKKAKFKDVDR